MSIARRCAGALLCASFLGASQPTQGWRRLGLLRQNEELTRERYVACIRRAAGGLRDAGFFSEATAASYAALAQPADLHPAREGA